jgi:hypothetical protein
LCRAPLASTVGPIEAHHRLYLLRSSTTSLVEAHRGRFPCSARSAAAAVGAAVTLEERRGAGRTRRKTRIFIFNLNFVLKEIEKKMHEG